MPFQPAPNIAQVQVHGTIDGQLTINNTYWQLDGGTITAINLASLVASVSNWAANSLAPLLAEDWQTIQVVGLDLSVENGFRVEQGVAANGGVSGEAAPNNVACCISFRTGLRGRSYHGRNYVPAIPNSLIDLNALAPTFLADLSSAYSTMIGLGGFSAGWQWGVLSRVQGGVPLGVAVLNPIINTTFSSGYVKSMRSRSVGHGI